MFLLKFLAEDNSSRFAGTGKVYDLLERAFFGMKILEVDAER